MASSAYRTPAGYHAYLRTPYWREFRLRILRRAAEGHRVPMCEMRGCHSPAYEVHHNIYDRVPWREHDADVLALCRHHHKVLHQMAAREWSAYRRGGRVAADFCGMARRLGDTSQLSLPLRR
jgi:hypothetical protein